MRSVRTAASTSNRIRRSRTAGTRSCASWSVPSGGVSGGTRSPRTNSRARRGNPGVPAFGTSLTAKAGPAVLHRLRRRRQASPARNPVSIRTCGAQILESPIEPGQGTGADLTGSGPEWGQHAGRPRVFLPWWGTAPPRRVLDLFQGTTRLLVPYNYAHSRLGVPWFGATLR